MAVSPAILKRYGCTPTAWKWCFTGPEADRLHEHKQLLDLIANRMSDGRTQNLSEFRPFAAIDLAYDVPFSQTTPTILNDLLGRNLKQEELVAQLKQWDIPIDEIFTKTTNTAGIDSFTVNAPTFYKVLVPLIKAYVTIRRAKLFNERNQSPLLKYEPLQSNAKNRLLCEILTDVVQVIASDYGYANDLKQAIFQALMYSFCLVFPKEAWHTEYQREEKDGVESKMLQKEGIRYATPHPTLVSWDLKHAPSTFNTDTGCEWAQYWGITSYGDLIDNPLYWNKRAVGYSQKDWTGAGIASNFFQEVYPCQLQFPSPAPVGSGTNREDNAAFYTTNQRDQAVFLTQHFMKLVPRRWKLGAKPGKNAKGKRAFERGTLYDEPIWVRFIVASDRTVLYAEPLAYSPCLYIGYDADALRSRNSSMALEILPFQDIVGNTLSQILLTCKQNLANVNFVDQNILSKGDVEALKGRGELLLRSLNFMPYDSTQNTRAGLDIKNAIFQVKFAYQDTTPLFTSLNTTLAILERLLQLSSQEQGAAASHQQSVEEVKQTAGSSSNRVMFTGSYVDDFIDGWKRQQRDAAVAYMDDEVESYVPGDIPDIEQHLEELGFKITSRGEGKLKVKGSKHVFHKIDTLAATGKGPERKNDSQVAQVMMQAATAVANNQMLSQALGPKPILKIIEMAAKLAGADKDFKLRPDQQQQLDQLQQMAQEIMQGAVKKIEADVTKPVADEVAKMQQQINTLEQLVHKMLGGGQAQPPTSATPAITPGLPAPAPQIAPGPSIAPQLPPPGQMPIQA